MLEVNNLHSYYGKSHIVRGVSLSVGSGEVISLLGRNGVGKTTLLRSFVGLISSCSGEVIFDGRDIGKLSTHVLARMGVVYMPESHGIFASLSVSDNLRLVVGYRGGGMVIDDVYDLFPRLAERVFHRAGQLSGGEQKMLCLARCLLLNPKLLLLDEPLEGLAPLMVREIGGVLEVLKGRGVAMVLVEQNFAFATHLADRVYVLGRGEVQFCGSGKEVIGNTELQAKWLGI